MPVSNVIICLSTGPGSDISSAPHAILWSAQSVDSSWHCNSSASKTYASHTELEQPAWCLEPDSCTSPEMPVPLTPCVCSLAVGGEPDPERAAHDGRQAHRLPAAGADKCDRLWWRFLVEDRRQQRGARAFGSLVADVWGEPADRYHAAVEVTSGTTPPQTERCTRDFTVWLLGSCVRQPGTFIDRELRA